MTEVTKGVGLHSGATCRVRLHQDMGHRDTGHQDTGGVRFRLGKVEILARAANVVATPRCTVLGADGARVAVVEHLLAALAWCGWWRGLVIELSAPELPILDGSALGWLEAIASLGPPPPLPAALTLHHARHLSHGETHITATPGPASLAVAIDFAHPAIGQQHWQGDRTRYGELMDARTFGFLHEVETLRTQGLARGASLDNSVVFAESPLTPLRGADEPVRHKALDLLGDLFLLGRPLEASLKVVRGSHQAHIRFVQDLLCCDDVSCDDVGCNNAKRLGVS